MVTLRRRDSVAILVLALIGVALWVGIFFWIETSAPTAPEEKKLLSRQEALDRFDRLTPEARLQLVEKRATADKEFQPAVRGDLVSTIVVRGSLEPVKYTDIYCTVKASTKGSAIIIKMDR